LLYYVCFPKITFTKLWQELYNLGIKPPFASEDLESLGTPEDQVTTVVDVSRYVDVKISSLNCHRTQIDPTGPFEQLPKDIMREIMSTEHYALVSDTKYAKYGDTLLNLLNSA
jgi:mycothiol S-conjugate amidase